MSPTIYPDRPETPPPSPSAPLPPIVEEDESWESPFKSARGEQPVAYRGTTSDPVFGYLIAVALSIGLLPLIPADADLRYVLIWTVMAGFGVLAWLLGNSARIWMETPENLGWGIIFGLIISVSFLLLGGETLRVTSQRLFINMSKGEVLAFLIFVIPLSETLFFRGVLQETRPFWVVGTLSSLWSVLVFFPLLDVRAYPAVALIIFTALVMMNVIYSYVRQRNGLAAAWLCQIVVNMVLLFLPLL
ncbi:MAG: hypothetical protein JNJ61_22840 [Anaerolineae bacterium]|nr:hypothetical protein [Anaerolineae bacterium]